MFSLLGYAAERLGFTKEAQVSPCQQITQWTCSAACLKAVLNHWGHDFPETVLTLAIGAKKGRGAETTEIVEAAKFFGFEAFEKSFDSLDAAGKLANLGAPIICDIQSFNHPGKGHYVVLTGINDEGVHLMDPNVEGNTRVITPEEMEERWFDHAMAPPHVEMIRWGVVVYPPDLK